MDVADEAQVERAFQETGPVDVLVNNAGTGTLSSLLDLEVEEWDRIMAVNLRGLSLASPQRFARCLSMPFTPHQAPCPAQAEEGVRHDTRP